MLPQGEAGVTQGPRAAPAPPPPAARESDPRKSAECARGKFSSHWDPRPHPTPHTVKFQDLKCFRADWVTHIFGRKPSHLVMGWRREGRGEALGILLLLDLSPGGRAGRTPRKVPQRHCVHCVPWAGATRRLARNAASRETSVTGPSLQAQRRLSQGGGGSGSPGWNRRGGQPQSY